MMLVGIFMVGCGSKDTGKETQEISTTEKSTTAETPTTTKKPSEEVSTEEPTTEYRYKGEKFAIEKEYKEYFLDLHIEKGYKFIVNDFVSKDARDFRRGMIVQDLMKALKFSSDMVGEVTDKYWSKGTTVLEIGYEDNEVIKYEKEVKKVFYLVKEGDKYCYFDVYTID